MLIIFYHWCVLNAWSVRGFRTDFFYRYRGYWISWRFVYFIFCFVLFFIKHRRLLLLGEGGSLCISRYTDGCCHRRRLCHRKWILPQHCYPRCPELRRGNSKIYLVHNPRCCPWSHCIQLKQMYHSDETFVYFQREYF